MYFIGVFLSIAALVSIFTLDTGRQFVVTTYDLSPEITILILISYCYPLLLFVLSYFINKEKISRKFFQSQVILSSTVCVSLGLIGTFIGLSSMVASISSGMGAEGDFNTKINILLSSIGASLDSMSLAFLTSILGVGASALLVVSCNYLAFFYAEENTSNTALSAVQVDADRPIEITPSIGATEIAEAINKALDLKMFKVLSDNIRASNVLQKQLTVSLEKFESTQERILNDGLDRISHCSDRVVEQMDANNNNLSALQSVFERFDKRFQECVEDFNSSLEQVSNFSYRIASEIDNNTNNLQSLQLVLERFYSSFQEYVTNFNQNVNTMTDFSEQIITKFNEANGNLSSLDQTFQSLEYSNKNNIIDFDELIENNTQQAKELSSVLFDLKFLLAPPLNEALESAIRNDSLEIVYQSQVDTNKNVIGCEVLLQWKDPIRGVVNNSEIFGADMESHPELMMNLDQWVINNSIKQLSYWIREGAWQEDWVLSINVVRHMAVDISLISYLKDVTEKYEVNPSSIAIEFKESIVLDKIDAIREIFKGIKSLGAKIYIDNYGKSYSSLVIYQQLEVDKLKIDRSVVNELISEDGDTSVVRSIMASARELGLELIVEGVEDDIQKMKLEQFGFSCFQGYLVAHPISGIEYLSTMNNTM